MNLSFQLVNQSSHEIILDWLRKPHVSEFFHGVGLQNTLSDLEKQIVSRHPQCQHWIASQNSIAFGYLITSFIKPQGEENDRFARHMKEEETAITLDILIGEEEFLGKGLAAVMIKSFLLDKFPDVTKVFIDPETANRRAIHVYEKVGFKKLEQFIAEWNPVPHWQMKMDVNDLLSNKSNFEKH